jgi:hypothetical protein
MVLAEHYPKILDIFPHVSSLQAVKIVGQVLGGVNGIK